MRVLVVGSDRALGLWRRPLDRFGERGIELHLVRYPPAEGWRGALLAVRDARWSAGRCDLALGLSSLEAGLLAWLRPGIPICAIDVGGLRWAEQLHRSAVVRALFRPLAALIGLTGAHCQGLAQLAPHAVVRRVHQPLPIPRRRSAPDRRHRYLLSVGGSGRDLRTLAAAASRLSAPVHVIDGTHGELVPAAGTLPPAGWPSNVVRSGRVASDSYWRALGGATAVILPLLPVAYPVGLSVLLDAVAAGVPIVASRVPATLEYLEPADSAWLVPPGDPEALASAAAEALDHPQLGAARAATAMEHLAQVASAEAAGDELRDALETALDAGVWRDASV